MTDAGARRLAIRLDGLPLALVTAGASLRKSTMTFDDYLEAYEHKWNIRPRRTLHLQDYQDRTLYTTWNMSFDRLQKENTDAVQMLILLAYFDNQEIWYELLAAGLDTDSPDWLQDTLEDQTSFEATMAVLVDYCLVELQHFKQLYSMHNCVHDWTFGELNKAIAIDLYWYAFDCVSNNIDKNDQDMFDHAKYNRLSLHARRLTHSRFKNCDGLAPGITGREYEVCCVACVLRQQGQFLAAEMMYKRVLFGLEKLGPDHTLTLAAVNDIGILYEAQNKLEEAEQMYEQALGVCETVQGSDHLTTLATVHNFGLLYSRQGKLDEAEQMFKRALAGYEALGSDNMAAALNTVNNLGILYAHQGKLNEAEQMYNRALAGRETAQGPDHPRTLNTIHNLSVIYEEEGNLDEAEKMYKRALLGRDTALGPGHCSTLNTVRGLANVYCAQGHVKKAEALRAKYNLPS